MINTCTAKYTKISSGYNQGPRTAASICSAKVACTLSIRNGEKKIPIKRHRSIDRITANELCKQAGVTPKFRCASELLHRASC